MNKTTSERIGMVIRNIGETIKCKKDVTFIKDGVETSIKREIPFILEPQDITAAVYPIFTVYEEEKMDLIKQRDDALKDAESKRFALEMIASNIYQYNVVDHIKEAMKTGLPGRKFD